MCRKEEGFFPETLKELKSQVSSLKLSTSFASWMNYCRTGSGIQTVLPRQRMRTINHPFIQLAHMLSLLTVCCYFVLSSSSITGICVHAFKTTISTRVLQVAKPMTHPRTSIALASVATKAAQAAVVTKDDVKIAIIGAGAAGLAAARVFSRNGYKPQVFEASPSLGGVWNYQQSQTTTTSSLSSLSQYDDENLGPMYKGLRTNLPRELMQFREFPWGNDGLQPSFVTHETVQSYLEDYATTFDLKPYIHFHSKVTHVTMMETNEHDDDDDDDDKLPPTTTPISIQWEQDASAHNKETFDVVCIANGHYALPSIPHISGLETHFTGRTLHSKYYDTPHKFTNQTVLCIGGRASGADLAREISAFAKQVYLSDSTCPIGDGEHGMIHNNIVWVPKTVAVESGSKIVFEKNCLDRPTVDTIVYCTGYDYQFPFLKESNLNLDCIPGERRVMPLYEQLWHARHLNLSFLGLPHSVVPFPLFELQAEAIVAQLKGGTSSKEGRRTLPDLQERLEASQKDANGGGPIAPGRVQDTHYFGSHQWKFMQRYAEYAGVWNESLERYINVNELIYNHSSLQRKGQPPGGLDEYRYNSYVRDDDNVSFQVKSFLGGEIESDIRPLASTASSAS